MKFKVFGPFPIAFDDSGNIPRSLKSFWKEMVDKKHPGLSGAKGCYVFGIKTSGSDRTLPWYIGKTNNQTFMAECFKPHQRNHYSRAINEYRRAKPNLYLIASLTSSGQFSTKNSHQLITFVEEYLIGFGLWANKKLLNKRDTKLYREITIPGILNSEKGSIGTAATQLKRDFYL